MTNWITAHLLAMHCLLGVLQDMLGQFEVAHNMQQ